MIYENAICSTMNDLWKIIYENVHQLYMIYESVHLKYMIYENVHL